MRFRASFLRRYKKAHQSGRVHIYKRPYLVPIVGLIVGVIIVFGLTVFRTSATLRPSNSHVVFIFDKGQKQTVDTQAPTVGDLVQRLPLHLIPEDVVEPSLNTPIVQDNFRINIYRARPVTVIDNGTKTVTLTAQKSPRVVAQNAGLTVYPEDNVSFATGDVADNTIGEEVIVDSATPVQLTLYGTPLTVRTHTKTVALMLKEKGIKIDPKDTLTPALDTPITANMQISVVRNGIQVITVQQPIDAPTQYVNDSSLTFGAMAVRQNGVAGKQAVTYQVDVEGGVEVSRTVIQQTVVQAAVPQIIAIGTVVDLNSDKSSVMASAGISPSDFGYVDYIVSHESGWCYTKAQGEHYCPAVPDNQFTPNGYGLCQATPGYKMASAGSDWATNPITQLRWCSGYAASRYGGWGNAYDHWLANHNW